MQIHTTIELRLSEFKDIINIVAKSINDTEHSMEEVEELIRTFDIPEEIVEYCILMISLYRKQ